MTRRVVAALVVAACCACRGGRAREERPALQPASSASVAVSAPPSTSAAAIGPVVLRGMPNVAVVLDDPRLAAAREQEQQHDTSGAARTVDVARATATLDAVQTCAWAYVAGRLHLAAGETSEAVAAFDRVAVPAGAAAPCALGPYGALREAQALVRLGRYDDAITRARSVGDDVPTHDEAELAIADACAGKGDRAAAVPIWRARLAASAHGIRWADTSIELASALLDGVDGPPESRAEEAHSLVSRVLVEAPWVADRIDLGALRARASSLLTRRPPSALTPEERAQQAQAWLDSAQPKHATEVAEALLKAVARGGKEHHQALCKAAIVRAQAKPRGKAADAAEAWGSAIARCEGEDSLVTALYYGAKASVSAHRSAEALERFARVEKLFPRHRLADDACFRAAVLTCEEGDEAHGLARLSSLPDTYPDGDMGAEALFRVAIARLGRRDLDGARDALERLLTVAPDAGHASTGRAGYFRARVAELAGDTDDAEKRYAALIREQPLGYYMLLAHARLRALNEAAARAALDAASEEPQGPFLTREHAELSSAAFERFVRLLEVGEIDSARREAHAGGLVAEGADPEVLWTIAWAYDHAGAPEIGHSFARTRLLDFREHWPIGRWRLAWEVAFPRVWATIVTQRSEETQVPVPLTWAIMREESAFNPDAHSIADAIGLMQLIAPTARATARGTQLPFDEESLHRPEVSIALGTRLLSSLRASFPANPALAIAAYNGGSRAVRRWLGERGLEDFDLFVERIPYDETRAYIKRVLASQAAYAYLYAPKALDELLTLPMHPSAEMVASP